MFLYRQTRFAVAIAISLTCFVFGAGGHLTALLMWHAVARTPGPTRRDRLYAWQTFWTQGLFALFCALMDLRVEYTLPDRVRLPVIALANHRSWLDIFLLSGALHRLGSRRLTAVVKREVGWIPVIGPFSRHIRCAHITRRDREADLRAIRTCAAHTSEDGASIVLFPEGTRFNDSGEANGVLKPKIGGFATLFEALPTYPVLVITVRWPPGVRARTMREGATLVGARIPILVSTIEPGNKNASETLAEAWRRMEEAFSRTPA